MITLKDLYKQLDHAKLMKDKNLRLWKLHNVDKWDKEILRIKRFIATIEEKERG